MSTSTTGRRAVKVLALSAAAAIVLASCSDDGSDAAPASSDDPVTITFVGADPATAFQPVIDAFEAENENITVEYQNVPFDQFNNVVQQRVGAQDPSIDVMYVDPSAIAGHVQRGWLEDLSEFQAEAEENSLEAAVGASSYEDKLYALPMWTSSQYLYYNTALLEAAGVEPPSGDPAERWTWEQVLDAAGKAQAAGAEWGLLFDQTDRYYQLQALPESAGGGSGAAGDDLLTPDVTNEGWVKAMTWYGDLFEQGYAPRGVTTDQMNVLFSSGEAAFFVGGPWSVAGFAEAETPFDFGIAPHPYFEGGTPAMPTDSWSLGVSTASDAKEAAKEFVRFASLDPEGNAATIEEILIPPTNQGAFEAYIERLDATKPPATTGMGALTLAELENATIHRPSTVGYTQLEEIMGRAFADIRNGEDVESTLEGAQQELESAWARLS